MAETDTYRMEKDGTLFVKKGTVFREFNYEETYRITRDNRTLLNKHLARKGVKKGNEYELGEYLIEAINWFINWLGVDPREIPKPERKDIHFKSSREAAMTIRDLLNRDTLINIILQLYNQTHEGEEI